MSLIVKEPIIIKDANHSFITIQEPLLTELCEKYGRSTENMCAKVFYGNPLEEGQHLRDALWGDSPPKDGVRKNTILRVGTQIQNVCHIEQGLSPRVFGITEGVYEGKRVAIQLTEYVNGEVAQTMEEVEKKGGEVKVLGKEFGFSNIKDIFNRFDVRGGKFVDLQPFAFDSFDAYREKVKEIYIESGRYGKVYYQDVPELSLSGGPRKSQKREEYMKLDKIDFKNKVVWDLGCAGGYFTRYAHSKGAKRVIGVDLEGPVRAAKHLANYLEMFNIDYLVRDLSKDNLSDLPKPDIVFLLSLNYHIPIPERTKEAKVVIFEDNGRETRHLEKLDTPWVDWFAKIELVGRGKDHGNKSVYHCIKD